MQYKPNPLRSGMTIIEVMTSIVVAMIGVMGVMILVPFAVRQAQTGMDTEAASVVARNAFAQFEIGGYRNYGNWIIWDSVNGATAAASTIPPQPFSIDPLGITENGSYVTTTFPFNVESVLPFSYPIMPANLGLPVLSWQPFSKADARRMFQAKDDLIFTDAQNSVGLTDAQLNGPSQIFDIEASGGTPVRRQAGNRFSWSAIAVPNKLPNAPISNASNWKLYVLVYKDRVLDVTALDTIPVNFAISPKMRAVQVKAPMSPASPVSTIQLDAAIADGSIRKDEWVMLINRKQVNPNAPVNNPVANGFDWQIGFYRIVNFQAGGFLTLDGPDFNFDTSIYQRTYCVHLKNVVSVFERTIVPEGNSVWNVAF